ncbi:MAG: phosphotyrosine protein phosphatase [Cellvibrionaceae bacterium]|nr:phosphotyrosine protein phosphatase [Cellvibrionaceae bacterium]
MNYISDHYATSKGLIRSGLSHLESLLGRTREFERVDLDRVERLVFVCLGNICRSPFGEFIAKNESVPAAGFGLSTSSNRPAFKTAIKTADKFDIDLSPHLTTDIQDFEIRESDLLLVMEVRHARRLKSLLKNSRAQIALLGRWASPRRLHIHDPFEHDECYFYHCYSVINQSTKNLISEWKLCKSRT